MTSVFENPGLESTTLEVDKVTEASPFGTVTAGTASTEEYNSLFFKAPLGTLTVQPTDTTNQAQYLPIELDTFKLEKRLSNYTWYRVKECRIQGKRDDAVVSRNGSVVMFVSHEPYQARPATMEPADAMRFPSSKILTFNDSIDTKFSWKDQVKPFASGWRPIDPTGVIPAPYRMNTVLGYVAKNKPLLVPYTIPVEISGTIEVKGYKTEGTAGGVVYTKKATTIPITAQKELDFVSEHNTQYLKVTYNEGTNVNGVGKFVTSYRYDKDVAVIDQLDEDNDEFTFAETHYIKDDEVHAIVVNGVVNLYFPTSITGCSNFPDPVLKQSKINKKPVPGYIIFEEEIDRVFFNGRDVSDLPEYQQTHNINRMAVTNKLLFKTMKDGASKKK